MVVVLGVTERDRGTPYNAQLIFDATGELVLKRAKSRRRITSAWSGAWATAAACAVVPTAAGRIGALACWEHYNPLARYALMAQHEEIHCSQFPGSLVGQVFADQMDPLQRVDADRRTAVAWAAAR